MAQKKGAEPQQDRAIEAKQKILTAALEEFAEHGFDRATTRSIAKRSGENAAMIRYYFGDKENLWKAAMETLFTRFLGRIQSAYVEVMTLPTERVAREMMHAFIRATADYPETIQILVTENIRKTERLRWLVETYIRPGFEMFQSVYQSVSPLFRVPAYPDVNLFYAMLGAASLVFASKEEVRILSGENNLTGEQPVAQHADLMLQLFFSDSVRASCLPPKSKPMKSRSPNQHGKKH